MSETTAAKQLAPYRFKPGQSGNPRGRPKGSKNKLSEDFLRALADDFAEHGVEAVRTVREEKPDQYLKVIASLVPKEMTLNINDESELSDEEIVARLQRLHEQLGPVLSSGGVLGASGGAEPETTH